MIERIESMPAGTIGFRGSGKLSRDDYREVLEPGLREALEGGEIRMLFTLTDFDGLQSGAWLDDIKTGLGFGIGHHSAWKRSAIATDIGWVEKAFELFAWISPGEVKVFDLDEIEEAKIWLVG